MITGALRSAIVRRPARPPAALDDRRVESRTPRRAAKRVRVDVGTTLGAPTLLLVAGYASAHTAGHLPDGFAAGFAHPFGGFDHLLAMVCVGVWGAFLGRPLIVVLPVIFPGLMVLGAALGVFGVAFAEAEAGIAVSVLTLGACIAAALRPPIALATAIVGAFAICHGYAHGRELPAATDPILYSLGFVLATGLLHVAGIGIGLVGERPRGRTLLRALGGAVCVAGMVFVVAAAGA